MGGAKPGRSRLERVLATLDGIVDWERRERGGMVRTLEPVRDLVRRLGDPQRAFRAVHIAGSKGKGSTAALVASALEAAGLRTGLYTSPHVERIGERVCIGGREIGEEALAEVLENAWEARVAAGREGAPGGEASWFDVMTAAAWLAFARARVQWAVVECGLGGRLDSTNVLAAEVAVVTSVSREHTAVLGHSLAGIAREKAAIATRGGVLVSGVAPRPEFFGEEDPARAIAQVAFERRARLVLVPEASSGPAGTRNAALAAAVLDALGERGVRGADGVLLGRRRLTGEVRAAARLPARGERFRVGEVPVVLDGAHTAESVALLLRELSEDGALRGPVCVVLALGRDKPGGAVLEALFEGLRLKGAAAGADRVFGTSVPTGPLRPAEEIARLAEAAGFSAESCPDPRVALERALGEARGGGWVLVVGSFYLAGAIRPLVRRGAGMAGPEGACSPSARTSF